MQVRIHAARAGDLGWTLMRQAELYKAEFGYLPLFENYVAQSVGAFAASFDARRDRLWVARRGPERVGAVAVQHDPARPGWAKLRWFFLEPGLRGQGLGRRLMATSLRFARKCDYKGIHLATVDDLVDARRLYESVGFRLVHTDPEPCAWAPWGREQEWEMRL